MSQADLKAELKQFKPLFGDYVELGFIPVTDDNISAERPPSTADWPHYTLVTYVGDETYAAYCYDDDGARTFADLVEQQHGLEMPLAIFLQIVVPRHQPLAAQTTPPDRDFIGIITTGDLSLEELESMMPDDAPSLLDEGQFWHSGVLFEGPNELILLIAEALNELNDSRIEYWVGYPPSFYAAEEIPATEESA